MKTDYPGIDYSLGKSNVDSNGIHYGVIPQDEVLQAWADDSVPNYLNPACPDCGYELAEDENPDELDECPECGIEFDSPDDLYPEEPIGFEYNDEGYAISQSYGDIDLFILKSNYFTYAQFCSPCAPGAGYILNWMDKESGGIRAYCLNHDWFEPQMTDNWIDCKYCNGRGIRAIDSIPNFNWDRFKDLVHDDNHVKCWTCNSNAQYGQIGKVKEMIRKAPYPVYSVETGELVDPIKE